MAFLTSIERLIAFTGFLVSRSYIEMVDGDEPAAIWVSDSTQSPRPNPWRAIRLSSRFLCVSLWSGKRGTRKAARSVGLSNLTASDFVSLNRMPSRNGRALWTPSGNVVNTPTARPLKFNRFSVLSPLMNMPCSEQKTEFK